MFWCYNATKLRPVSNVSAWFIGWQSYWCICDLKPFLSSFTCLTKHLNFLCIKILKMWFWYLVISDLYNSFSCSPPWEMPKSCSGTYEFVSQQCVIIIQWSVWAEQFVPFSYKSNSRRLFHFREPFSAVERGLEGKYWKLFHTVNHWRIAAWLLFLFSLSVCSLFLTFCYRISLLSFSLFMSLIFLCNFPLIPSECRSLQQIWCVICPFFIRENLRSAWLDTFHKCQCF